VKIESNGQMLAALRRIVGGERVVALLDKRRRPAATAAVRRTNSGR